MPAAIVARPETTFTVLIEIPYGSSMLDGEGTLQQRLNQAGTLATAELLRRFDTDGAPIQVGDTKLTSKGKLLKQDQTPDGGAPVERHVSQGSRGGRTDGPLERNARIVVSSTPRFAKMASFNYAEFGSARVIKDLAENHRRAVARCFVQDVAAAVAAVALAKEGDWASALPGWEEPVVTVTIGMDGTCLPMGEDGWRETMVGTLGSYDEAGGRPHTIDLGATPGYGRATFLDRLEREVERVKAAFPEARYLGLADGAKGHGEFLERHTEAQVIDVWPGAEDLSDAADVLFARTPAAQEAWLGSCGPRLRHEAGAARPSVRDLKRLGAEKGVPADQAAIAAALRSVTNQSRRGRMDDAPLVEARIPIGSGVPAAACTVLVKPRWCGSGRKGKGPGAGAVLSLRWLTDTRERWSQFWGKIDQDGYPVAA
jgi:hypothetical protein